MQGPLAKSNASNLRKHPSQTLLYSKPSPLPSFTSSPKALHPLASLLTGTADPPQSILQMIQPSAPDLTRISSRVQLKNRRGILQDTEQRIFSEVIELLDQIDDLRTNIIHVRDEIRELQVTHPDIDQQVRFHGYGQSLTQQQCSDLEQENLELIKQIEQIESKQVSSLEEVLRIQKQKYEELKQELSDSRASGPKNLQEKIKDLKNSIAQLQNSRNAKVRAQFPQFDHIKLKNQQLRKKTLLNLKGDGYREQEEQLKKYLQTEEESRGEFMEELKKFKYEYNRLKNQNQVLAERLERRRMNESKENSNIQYRNKIPSHKSLQVESQIKKRGTDKLREYQSHIKMMQTMKN